MPLVQLIRPLLYSGRTVFSGVAGGGGGEEGALPFPGLPNNWTAPGVVEHLYEDWSTYSTVNDIETTSRVDGGTHWNNVIESALSFQTGNVCPWFGVKRLRTTHPTGSGLGGSYGMDMGGGGWMLNTGSMGSSFVLQFSFRCANGVMYCGKFFDLRSFTGGIAHRYTDESQSSGRTGATTTPNCDGDGFCNLYYSNNGDTARFPNILPTTTDYDFVWFSQMSDPSSNNCFYKMNRNGTTGGLQNNLASYEGGDWWLRTVRFTMATVADGNGRIEAWETDSANNTTKILEVIGDPGEFDAGHVWMPREDDGENWWPMDTFRVCAPSRADTGDGWNGGSQTEIGGISVITHDRISL